MRRRTALALVAALAVSYPANADVLHVPSNSTLYTDIAPYGQLRLPPGYFVDEDTWRKLDNEVRRLQDAETRLDAENKSLRRSASRWPGWYVVGAAVLTGVAVGYYAAR